MDKNVHLFVHFCMYRMYRMYIWSKFRCQIGQKWTKCTHFSNIVLFAWKCVETDFKLKYFENYFFYFLVQSDFWKNFTSRKFFYCLISLEMWWNGFQTKNVRYFVENFRSSHTLKMQWHRKISHTPSYPPKFLLSY